MALLVHGTTALAPLSHGRAALVGVSPDEASTLSRGNQSRPRWHGHAVADAWVLAGRHVALDVGGITVDCVEGVVVETEILALHEPVESPWRGRWKVLVIRHVAIEAAEAVILRRLRSMIVTLTHRDLSLVVVLRVVGELSLMVASAVALAMALAVMIDLVLVVWPGLIIDPSLVVGQAGRLMGFAEIKRQLAIWVAVVCRRLKLTAVLLDRGLRVGKLCAL